MIDITVDELRCRLQKMTAEAVRHQFFTGAGERVMLRVDELHRLGLISDAAVAEVGDWLREFEARNAEYRVSPHPGSHQAAGDGIA